MLATQSKELMFYFDKIRIARKMTIDDFIFGIISERQYRRYIRGETNLNPQVISAFSDRLGQKTEHVLLNFESYRLKETQIINQFHNMIVNNHIDGSYDFEKSYLTDEIANKNNRYLYEFALLIRDHKTKKANSLSTISKIKELIDYDTMIHHTTFSSSEIIILTSLLKFDDFKEHEIIISLLERYIEHNEVIISGFNDRMLVLALYHLMSYYGSLGYQDKTEHFALKAISINQEAKSLYLLEDFYFTLAYVYKKQNKLDAHNKFLYQCLNILYLDAASHKSKRFKSLIEKHFSIDIKDFMIDYFTNIA